MSNCLFHTAEISLYTPREVKEKRRTVVIKMVHQAKAPAAKTPVWVQPPWVEGRTDPASALMCG